MMLQNTPVYPTSMCIYYYIQMQLEKAVFAPPPVLPSGKLDETYSLIQPHSLHYVKA